jgi:hypothetical protein
MIEKGVVKFFDSRMDKMFGFIRLESGEEIFFHQNDFGLLNANDDGSFNFYGTAMDCPRRILKGNIIYFEREEGSRGRSKASPWCFEENYKSALEHLASRTKYRVRKQTVVYAQLPNEPDQPETLWEGTDLDALMLKYPRTGDRTDDIFPTFSCGDFQHSIWFEQQKPDGTWKLASDPRHVTGRRRMRYA